MYASVSPPVAGPATFPGPGGGGGGRGVQLIHSSDTVRTMPTTGAAAVGFSASLGHHFGSGSSSGAMPMRFGPTTMAPNNNSSSGIGINGSNPGIRVAQPPAVVASTSQQPPPAFFHAKSNSDMAEWAEHQRKLIESNRREEERLARVRAMDRGQAQARLSPMRHELAGGEEALRRARQAEKEAQALRTRNANERQQLGRLTGNVEQQRAVLRAAATKVDSLRIQFEELYRRREAAALAARAEQQQATAQKAIRFHASTASSSASPNENVLPINSNSSTHVVRPRASVEPMLVQRPPPQPVRTADGLQKGTTDHRQLARDASPSPPKDPHPTASKDKRPGDGSKPAPSVVSRPPSATPHAADVVSLRADSLKAAKRRSWAAQAIDGGQGNGVATSEAAHIQRILADQLKKGRTQVSLSQIFPEMAGSNNNNNNGGLSRQPISEEELLSAASSCADTTSLSSVDSGAVVSSSTGTATTTAAHTPSPPQEARKLQIELEQLDDRQAAATPLAGTPTRATQNEDEDYEAGIEEEEEEEEEEEGEASATESSADSAQDVKMTEVIEWTTTPTPTSGAGTANITPTGTLRDGGGGSGGGFLGAPKSILRPPSTQRRSNASAVPKRRVEFDPLALLLDAALEGELDLVKRSADKMPSVSASNDEGITALHNAICAGHYEIVKFLIEKHADVNAQDSDGWTPLHCAASCNNLPMVRLLVEAGACVLASTLSDLETPAEKCEEGEDGYAGCLQYLLAAHQATGSINDGKVYAAWDYEAERDDELSFAAGDVLRVLEKDAPPLADQQNGSQTDRGWWACERRADDQNLAGEEKGTARRGLVPRTYLALYAPLKYRERVQFNAFEVPPFAFESAGSQPCGSPGLSSPTLSSETESNNNSSSTQRRSLTTATS